MPRQQTVQNFRVFAGQDLTAPQDIDYDADYCALDLTPGAPLREIEDRARLLRAAFQPDQLPALKTRAEARSQIINRAADELSRYWKAYGAPPPTSRSYQPGAMPEQPGQVARPTEAGDRPGFPDGLLAALADALGAGITATADGAAVDRRAPLWVAVRDTRGGQPLGMTRGGGGDRVGPSEGGFDESGSAPTVVIPGCPEGTDPESRSTGFSERSQSGVHGFRVRRLRPRPGMTLLQEREVRDRPVAVLHPHAASQPAPHLLAPLSPEQAGIGIAGRGAGLGVAAHGERIAAPDLSPPGPLPRADRIKLPQLPPPPLRRPPAARQVALVEGGRQRPQPHPRDPADQPPRISRPNQRPTGAVSEPAPNPGNAPRSERLNRRAWSIARSVLVKLAIVGLVIAAALWLQQYRADHPSLGRFPDPNSAIATGLPGDPPARWSGLSGHQPAGAAAPAIAGHQRQN